LALKVRGIISTENQWFTIGKSINPAKVCNHLAHETSLSGSRAMAESAAGDQAHHALIGRTFLQSFTMIYEGRTGTVTIHND
jgi:hypothetical protein